MGRSAYIRKRLVLMVFVLGLNLLVDRIGRSQADATGLTTAGAVV